MKAEPCTSTRGGRRAQLRTSDRLNFDMICLGGDCASVWNPNETDSSKDEMKCR